MAAHDENRFSDQYYFHLFNDLEEHCKIESENSDDDDDEDDSVQMLRGFMGKLDIKRREMFKKFVSKFEDHVTMEELLRILKKLSRYDGNDRTATDRGVNEDDNSIFEDIKLERFKVKTVNVVGSGVVKEEQE
ncbi:hypothetical protein BUALT_Bualt11G0100500 [Buddleja alternifolia]|uniref:Uncharacterized protein n=1 Tax=Buddleja alternifolia TaxID=168488 RepID=A0AAV6X157_9LAMI|nr:hypothetical protein BUALT_Bualt11G0100500 [Buddleja alternifolia]